MIPPNETYETARYGDRPFPVVPVNYLDLRLQPTTSARSSQVINDPAVPGSTFNLFQEMSLGQLFPEGTVPSDGIATADFTYAPGFEFTEDRARARPARARPWVTPRSRRRARRSTPSGSPTASTTCPARPSTTAPTPTARP